MGKTANIMRKAYYIENKTFYEDGAGRHIMAADLGSMPIICTSQKQGIKRYHRAIETYNNLLNYETEKEYTSEEIGVGNCMARTDLRHKTLGNKTIISLYQIWI